MADTKHRRPEQDTVVQGNFRVPKLSECVEKHLDDMGILEKNKASLLIHVGSFTSWGPRHTLCIGVHVFLA